MFQLRGLQKLNRLFQFSTTSTASTTTTTIVRSRHTFSLVLRDSLRHFSTENERPSRQSRSQSQSQSLPKFSSTSIFPPDTGLVYGKLIGISPNTLKTDIIHMFQGCDLTLDDIKVDYDRKYYPLAMLVQFSSNSKFNIAFKELSKNNRYFKLEKVDRQQWDLVTPYNGRYVLFQGIPREAITVDVERLLCGCSYDASSLEIFTRQLPSGPVRFAKARFPSQIEAMNAVVRKNGAFCRNNRIMARIIQ